MGSATRSSSRFVCVFAAFSALGAALTVTLCWPRMTMADGDSPIGVHTLDGMKFGDIVVNGELVADKGAKSGWAMMVTAKNMGDHDETCDVQAELTRTMVNPMARSAPPAEAIWKKRHSWTVLAHETVKQRIEIPAAFAVQVAQAAREQRLRETLKTRDFSNSYKVFNVAFRSLAKPSNHDKGAELPEEKAEIFLESTPTSVPKKI